MVLEFHPVYSKVSYLEQRSDMECVSGIHHVYTMQDKGWHGYRLESISVSLAHIPYLNAALESSSCEIFADMQWQDTNLSKLIYLLKYTAIYQIHVYCGMGGH